MNRRGFDIPLILVVGALLVVGLVMVQSASSPVAVDRLGDPWYYVKRQAFAVGMGLAGCVAAALTPQAWIRKNILPFCIAVVVGLVAVFGFREINGSHRWISMGSVNLQPSEFAKLAVMLAMAHFIDVNKGRVNDLPVLGKACLIPAPFMALIFFEPDFGTTAIVGGIAFLVLVTAGVRTQWIVGLIVGSLAIGVPALMMESYRVERVMSFLDPWKDASGVGYQVIQSMIAFQSGGVMGRGLGESQAKHLFLPEPWTDFVAAVLGEELGLVGIAALLALYAVFVWRGIEIARRSKDLFGMLLATAATGIIGLQAVFNLGVVMGVVPNKGLVLPFMSYGASAIMAHLISVGLLLNVSAHATVERRAPAIYRATVLADGVE